MNQGQLQAIDYLQEENRVLREQLGERRLRPIDDRVVTWPPRPRDYEGSFSNRWPRLSLGRRCSPGT
jgi:hypothetical protein